jgi:light-independent protochlorophyllide reductase subunit B
MEDHLLEIFGGHDTREIDIEQLSQEQKNILIWDNEAKNELNNIPGFVRSKIKKSIEKFAIKNNINKISLEVMYNAKELGET